MPGDGTDDPGREELRAARPAMAAAVDPVQDHGAAARRGPGDPRHERIARLGRQFLVRRAAGDAVARRPVRGDGLRPGDPRLAGLLTVPGGPAPEYPPAQAAPGERAALVGHGTVAGPHQAHHRGAQQRDRRGLPAELERGSGHKEQARHRQQAVPGHMLGEPGAVRHPGEKHGPGPGRALRLQPAGELREEARVVQVGLAGRRPHRVPDPLPPVGEHGGHSRGRAAGRQPGEPRHALAGHPGAVQDDEQRRARLRRPGQPVGAPDPGDVDGTLLKPVYWLTLHCPARSHAPSVEARPVPRT
jgi:hypothetical protein